MCVKPERGLFVSQLAAQAVSVSHTHISLSLLFHFSVRKNASGVGEGGICSVCQPDLAEIDLVYALADCLLMRWGFIIHRLMAVI